MMAVIERIVRLVTSGSAITIRGVGRVSAVVGLVLVLSAPALAVPANDAVFVRQSAPPTKMFVSQTATVSVTMQNTGTATWTWPGAYILVPVNPAPNTNWGLSYVQLSTEDSIAPGQKHTFLFAITAPDTPGTYVFRWQMHQYAYGTYFGELSREIVVQVREPGCDVTRFTIADNSDEETFQAQSAGPWPPCGPPFCTPQQIDDSFAQWLQRSVNLGTAAATVTSARWLTGAGAIPADAEITAASLGMFIGGILTADGVNFAADWVTENDSAPSAADYVHNLSRTAFGDLPSDSVTAQSPSSGEIANAYFQLADPAQNIDRALNGWTKLVLGIMPAAGSAPPTGVNLHFGRSAEFVDDDNQGALTLDVYWCRPVPTWTPVPTRTPSRTFTVTATATRTPTAQPGCQYSTFRLPTPSGGGTSADDGYMSKIDHMGAWPPAGGSGLVTTTPPVTVIANGASNVNDVLWYLVHEVLPNDYPLPRSWPEILGTGLPSSWAVWNLAVTGQTSVNMTMQANPPPWVEVFAHRMCWVPGTETKGVPSFELCPCSAPEICTGGGTTGLASDLEALNPDVVILTPESNDAYLPWSAPDQLTVTPEDIVDGLQRQCDWVEEHNPTAVCIVPTMHKPPYVADVPYTSDFIDEVNEILLARFPRTRVVDFSTGSSDKSDYPWDDAHFDQRLHDKRASRVLATLTQTTFATAAPILETEIRQWNGTSGRSVAFVRFPTAALPNNTQVRRAILDVVVSYSGAHGVTSANRNIGIQWANAAAQNGWAIDDWPTTLTANAYNGAPNISAAQRRSFRWSFTLEQKTNVSLTGFTGFFIYVRPDNPVGADQYFTADLVSIDSPSGPPEAGDEAPRLTVYHCPP